MAIKQGYSLKTEQSWYFSCQLYMKIKRDNLIKNNVINHDIYGYEEDKPLIRIRDIFHINIVDN